MIEPNVMNHAEIEARDVVDRYVLGQLPPEEAARFEDHYLSCPDCLERLELTEKLVRGLRRGAAEGARVGFLTALARLGLRHRLGLAAALVLVLALPFGWAVRRGAQLEAALERAFEPQAGTPVLRLDAVRGEALAGAPTHRVRRPSEPGWIVVTLALGGVEAPLAVTLADASGAVLWQAADLAPDAAGDLAVSLPASRLAPGDYTFLVAGPATRARFAFRVLASDG